MWFVNAGIFDDIEYSVVRAAEGTAHELKVLGKEAVDGTKSAGKTIYYGTKSAGKAIYHGASDVYNDYTFVFHNFPHDYAKIGT
jgi:hypothetical protein